MFDFISRLWHRRGVQKLVRRHGWTGIYVGDYESIPTWAYTIGFRQTLGAPEVVVFDLPQDVANSLLWHVFDDIRSGALVLRDGERWGDGQQACWRRVHRDHLEDEEQAWLGLSQVYASILWPDAGEFEAFQLVLADNEGRLPWEAGYDERLRPRQRELYLARDMSAEQVAEAAAV